MKETDFLIHHWNEMTETFQRFSQISKLSCPSNCSLCCEEHRPSVTTFEMLPAAEEIFNQGLMDEMMKLIDEYPRGHCVLIQNHRCQVYNLRPSLCRLFGLGRIENKNANKMLPSFSVCKILRKENHEKIENLSKLTELQKLKTFKELYSPIQGQIPQYESEELPINEALKKALVKIAFKKSYERESV